MKKQSPLETGELGGHSVSASLEGLSTGQLWGYIDYQLACTPSHQPLGAETIRLIDALNSRLSDRAELISAHIAGQKHADFTTNEPDKDRLQWYRDSMKKSRDRTERG